MYLLWVILFNIIIFFIVLTYVFFVFLELDLIPGVGTFVLCLTLPIELGILTGVVVNIIFILYHAARPKFSVEMLKVSIAEH